MVMKSVSDNARFYISSIPGTIAVIVVFIVVPLVTGDAVGEVSQIILAYLIFWPLSVGIFVFWTYRVHLAATRSQLRAMIRQANDEERRWWFFLVNMGKAPSWTILGAGMAVLVTALVGQTPEVREQPLYIALSLLTLASSWILMVFAFAVYYERMSLSEGGEAHFRFHIEGEATIDDFVTLAVLFSTMGATAPADVRTTRAWRMVRTNVVLAFAFNSIIVAMVVSVMVGGIAG